MFLSQDLCVVCNFWSSARRKESRATPQRALAKNVSQKFRSCGFGAVWQLVFWRWNSLRCVFVTGMAVARTILLCWMFVWFDFVANNATTCFFFEWVCNNSIELVYVWFHSPLKHFMGHVIWFFGNFWDQDFLSDGEPRQALGRALEGQGHLSFACVGMTGLLGGCGHGWWKPWTFYAFWKSFFRVWKIESAQKNT